MCKHSNLQNILVSWYQHPTLVLYGKVLYFYDLHVYNYCHHELLNLMAVIDQQHALLLTRIQQTLWISQELVNIFAPQVLLQPVKDFVHQSMPPSGGYPWGFWACGLFCVYLKLSLLSSRLSEGNFGHTQIWNFFDKDTQKAVQKSLKKWERCRVTVEQAKARRLDAIRKSVGPTMKMEEMEPDIRSEWNISYHVTLTTKRIFIIWPLVSVVKGINLCYTTNEILQEK